MAPIYVIDTSYLIGGSNTIKLCRTKLHHIYLFPEKFTWIKLNVIVVLLRDGYYYLEIVGKI